jgi:hypothetical protein
VVLVHRVDEHRQGGEGSHEIRSNPNQPTEFPLLPNRARFRSAPETPPGIIGQLKKLFSIAPHTDASIAALSSRKFVR